MNNKIKLVLSIALMIASLFVIFKSFVGGICILLAGLVLFPKVSNILLKSVPIWENRAVRIATPILLFVIGASTNTIQNKDAIALDKKENVVINYIKANIEQDKSLNNIKMLDDIGSIFNNGNYALSAPSSHLQSKTDSITKITTFTLNPVYDFETAIKSKYLNPDDKKGAIKDYQLIFEIDKNNNITSKKTIIEYAKTGKEEFENKAVPEIALLIDQTVVKSKKELITMEEEKKKGMEEYNKRVDKFEKKCINPWDGSCTVLYRLIKEQTNDPDSFKHVKTTYRLFGSYAVVNMTFRGKNKFNGTVTNSVSAKISLDDCSVLEILN